jgi:hypothetical protein
LQRWSWELTEDLYDYVPRTDVESFMKKILTTGKVNNYWVVSGEHDNSSKSLQ